MPVNLSLKNVPDSIHKRLRSQAARHGRSMNSEILNILAAATRRDAAVSDLLGDLRAFDLRLAGREMEPVNLNEAIRDGRE
ncbi:MAG: plasmid stabilization protein [Bacteroidetes bacterium CG12_big_fil_rev_8_21_14_0_65_60_17]|nr:MAG: plasmid stabilization protein [Bacteroidetes bacterium CG12_big_fil_rev_8_21_14_0_65_60_17]